jgi:hypothetical protein
MLTALILMLTLAADPALTTIARGPASAVDEAREATALTEVDWEALWTAHAGRAPLPEVDFSTEMVVAVFLGTRPTGGFGVEIIGAHTENGALVVEYVERRPGRGGFVAQVLTTPFHIVKVPRHEGAVRFLKQ